ncbi:hypothetical protein DW058_02430 [Clostridiaceae bacterium AF42-6]|nr:hypothetical protein DW058_02430 [Clostridiaceae bacterium AF42-6]
MAYKHGIRIQENPTNVAAPVMLENGVPVIFGTAPVNLAANPKAATNQLFLCKTFAEAVQNLGYSDDYESYTLCQAMDAFFKAFGVGPVVYVMYWIRRNIQLSIQRNCRWLTDRQYRK